MEQGKEGESAYQLWLRLGNTGTEQDFIDSLHGKNGLSAYDIWLRQPNVGSISDFLASFNGKDGQVGASIYEIWLALGNIGTEQDLINSLQGNVGSKGESAYQIWLSLGNRGTIQDFIASLKGDDGKNGSNGEDGINSYQVWLSLGNRGTIQDFIASLKGDDGQQGRKGDRGSGKPSFDNVSPTTDVLLTTPIVSNIWSKWECLHDISITQDSSVLLVVSLSGRLNEITNDNSEEQVWTKYRIIRTRQGDASPQDYANSISYMRNRNEIESSGITNELIVASLPVKVNDSLRVEGKIMLSRSFNPNRYINFKANEQYYTLISFI